MLLVSLYECVWANIGLDELLPQRSITKREKQKTLKHGTSRKGHKDIIMEWRELCYGPWDIIAWPQCDAHVWWVGLDAVSGLQFGGQVDQSGMLACRKHAQGSELRVAWPQRVHHPWYVLFPGAAHTLEDSMIIYHMRLLVSRNMKRGTQLFIPAGILQLLGQCNSTEALMAHFMHGMRLVSDVVICKWTE